MLAAFFDKFVEQATPGGEVFTARFDGDGGRFVTASLSVWPERRKAQRRTRGMRYVRCASARPMRSSRRKATSPRA